MDQKRNAERLPLATPLDATAGERPVRILEISLIGCRIEHIGKLNVSRGMVLEFHLGGKEIRVPYTIARSEMREFTAAGPKFESGLFFAGSVEDAPLELKGILAALVEESPALPNLHVKVPFLRWYDNDEEDEAEPAPEPEYVEGTLEGKTWKIRPVREGRQPLEGFTTFKVDSDEEMELLCRTYEYADPDTRKLIRLSLELQIAERLRR